MPTYDYECRSCGHSFEAFQSMSEDPLTQCPECGKNELRRLIGGGTGIIFKGSGFYINDSRKAGSSTTGSSGVKPKSTEKSSSAAAASAPASGGKKESSSKKKESA